MHNDPTNNVATLPGLSYRTLNLTCAYLNAGSNTFFSLKKMINALITSGWNLFKLCRDYLISEGTMWVPWNCWFLYLTPPLFHLCPQIWTKTRKWTTIHIITKITQFVGCHKYFHIKSFLFLFCKLYEHCLSFHLSGLWRYSFLIGKLEIVLLNNKMGSSRWPDNIVQDINIWIKLI